MKIVIDIPDEQIEKSLEESKYIHENEGEKGFVNISLLYTNRKLEFVDIVRKYDFYSLKDEYTIIPEKHGRLIDADFLIKQYHEYCKGNCIYTESERNVMCRACHIGYAIETLENAPTVLPETGASE